MCNLCVIIWLCNVRAHVCAFQMPFKKREKGSRKEGGGRKEEEGGRKERREEGRKEGRKKGRMEGRKEGRRERRKNKKG